MDKDKHIETLEREVQFLRQRLELEQKLMAATIEWGQKLWEGATKAMDDLTALRLQNIRNGVDWQVQKEEDK